MSVAGGAKVSAENGRYPLHSEFARLSRIGELNAAPVFRDRSVQVLMEKVSRHFGPLDGATLARGRARTKMADQPFVPLHAELSSLFDLIAVRLGPSEKLRAGIFARRGKRLRRPAQASEANAIRDP
jgi:hypothetical protein